MRIPPWRRATPEERAADFWRWWPSVRNRLHDEVEASQPADAHRALERHIAAIDARLGWLIEPGSWARHRLVLRPLGPPLLRELARAWDAAAPRADGIWEFAPSRPATRDLPQVEVEGESIDTAEIRVEPNWDTDREVMNVRAWHPAFAALEPESADGVVVQALLALLGDDDVERWLGSLDVDPLLESASRLADLRGWLDRASAGATGIRWLTVLRLNQRGESVAFRFNAALKRIDHPGAHDIVAVDIPRELDRVDAAEPAPILSAIRDLEGQLGQSAVRASETSEPSRLSVTFVTDDGQAVARTVDRWSAAHRGMWAEARTIDAPEWVTFGHGADDPETDEPRPLITPRTSTALDRRARWIERHPWRLISGPLLVGAAAIVLGAAVPSLSVTASVLFIVAFGVGALAVGVYLLAEQHLLMREHPAVGCLWLIVHGWWGIVALGVGFFALLIAILWVHYGGG